MSRILCSARLIDNWLTQGGAMDSTQSQASILAVDDDTRNLMALQGLLSDMSLKLVTAKSGEEALRCVLKQDFAVILMDARMPGVDGFEAARLIREHERSRHTPIIFLTSAYEDPPSVTRGYEAGAVDYIVKPLMPEILKSKISVFVDLYRNNAMLLEQIKERLIAEEHLRASQQSLRALASHVQSVREIMSQLRPEVLDRLGLAAAIGWQAGEFQRRSGIRCNVALPAEDLLLDSDRSTAVFRIFQELLTNVARHAGATRIDVAVRSDSDELVLTVEDNGRGIDAEVAHSPKSFGLMGVRERVLPFGGGP